MNSVLLRWKVWWWQDAKKRLSSNISLNISKFFSDEFVLNETKRVESLHLCVCVCVWVAGSILSFLSLSLVVLGCASESERSVDCIYRRDPNWRTRSCWQVWSIHTELHFPAFEYVVCLSICLYVDAPDEMAAFCFWGHNTNTSNSMDRWSRKGRERDHMTQMTNPR